MRSPAMSASMPRPHAYHQPSTTTAARRAPNGRCSTRDTRPSTVEPAPEPLAGTGLRSARNPRAA
jgi:hypothetical protein